MAATTAYVFDDGALRIRSQFRLSYLVGGRDDMEWAHNFMSMKYKYCKLPWLHRRRTLRALTCRRCAPQNHQAWTFLCIRHTIGADLCCSRCLSAAGYAYAWSDGRLSVQLSPKTADVRCTRRGCL